MRIEQFSFGMGDRFAQQGRAQLAALVQAKTAGVDIAPVWNKSHREHTTIGTLPPSVREEADAAVRALGWTGNHYVDADHIGLGTVDLFLEASDFFTLDVADFIGKPVDAGTADAFVAAHAKYGGTLDIPGLAAPLEVTRDQISGVAAKYLGATAEAGRIYRHIAAAKGADNFVTEVSMDETALAQTPAELLFILAALAAEGVPAQTIAPKFSGRFNKGVEYVGDPAAFAREFEDDLAVIAFAVAEFGLPPQLKLSVHSGSDKFAIYGPIRAALRKTDAGVHVKTAGTTWLEELIGLAEAGDAGLAVAKRVYRRAYAEREALCAPYATVIDIDASRLPAPDAVDEWSGAEYAAALRHDQSRAAFNPHFRQLLHVGYKVAAKLGDEYLEAVRACEASIARNVTENLFERHLRPLFLDA